MGKMTVKMMKMVKIANKLDDEEYKSYKGILKSAGIKKDELELIDRHYAVKNIDVKQGGSTFEYAYKEELNKVTKILNNGEIIKKIGGLKIMMHGPTGTGKTTFVNQVAKLNKTYNFDNIQLEEYVSPKMGQTQINFINLANEINNKGRQIIFLDELDSVISSRNKSNDVGEHSRIVATFIKFLDKLNSNVVLFAATNILDSIDVAVSRRFPVKIETYNLSSIDFFEKFHSETKHKMSKQLLNTISDLYIDNIFSLADLKYLEDYLDVEEAIDGGGDFFTSIIKSLSSKKIDKTKFKELSRRKKESLIRVGLYE